MNTPIKRPSSFIAVVDERRYSLTIDETQRTDMTELAYKAQVETARATHQWPALFYAIAMIVVCALPIAGLLGLAAMMPSIIADGTARTVAFTALCLGVAAALWPARGLIKTLMDRMKAP
jgi:hypothetical protein